VFSEIVSRFGTRHGSAVKNKDWHPISSMMLSKIAKGNQMTKKNVLFLCTGNSCRSQMAEGWTRHFHGGTIKAYSAGIEAHGVNPLAMQVMREAGVDISGQSSKLASSLADVPLDLVITVCGHADEHCPAFLTRRKLVHVGFDDPPRLAMEAASEEEALDHYRRVRDEIRSFIKADLPKLIQG
jgi:arsenate reductase